MFETLFLFETFHRPLFGLEELFLVYDTYCPRELLGIDYT